MNPVEPQTIFGWEIHEAVARLPIGVPGWFQVVPGESATFPVGQAKIEITPEGEVVTRGEPGADFYRAQDAVWSPLLVALEFDLKHGGFPLEFVLRRDGPQIQAALANPPT
jgi:hypothetical protein